MLQFKQYASLFLSGLLTGGLLVLLLMNGHGKTDPKISALVKPAVLAAGVHQLEIAGKHQLDSLKAASDQLKEQLQSTSAQLAAAKRKNKQLQTQVYDLLDRMGSAPTDSTATVAGVDSLKTNVDALLSSDQQKDSLYEASSSNLQQQLAIKDSSMAQQAAQYQALKSVFAQSLDEQQQLTQANKTLTRKLHRQKIGGTLKTIGLVIATAFATHYVSQH